jgi:hypothetical protein
MTHRMLCGLLAWPFLERGDWRGPREAAPRFLLTNEAVEAEPLSDGSAVVRAAGDARLYRVPAGFLEPIDTGVSE